MQIQDLITIYKHDIRSLIELNVAVWSSSITNEESEDIERVQKVAIKIILKDKYTNYEESLTVTGLEKLPSWRKVLCLKFAKNCLNNDKMASLFPLNPRYKENSRNSERYKVNFTHSNRFKYSAITALQRLLNY